jgi:hypothetical protein
MWLAKFAEELGRRIQKDKPQGIVRQDRKTNERLSKTLKGESLVKANFDSVLLIVLLIMTVVMLQLWYG